MKEHESFGKISIIIPFYNAAGYLKKCIDSIISQSYRELEIILINDGSTDNSKDIAQQYLSDGRITLLDSEKSGVSFARNKGLEYATGEWLLFVDADDYLAEDILYHCVTKFDKYTGAVEFGFSEDSEDTGTKTIKNNGGHTKVMSRDEMIEEFFHSSVGHYQGYLWNKMLRRRMIEAKHIRFHTEISYNEDRLFLLEYFMNLDKDMQILYIPQVGYHYIRNSMSAMGSIQKQPLSKVITEIYAFEEMDKLLKEKNYSNTNLVNASIQSCFKIFCTYDVYESPREWAYLKKYLKIRKGTGKKVRLKRMLCLNRILFLIYQRKGQG